MARMIELEARMAGSIGKEPDRTGADGWWQRARLGRRDLWRVCAATAWVGFGATAELRAAAQENDAMAVTQLGCDAFKRGDVAAIETLLRPDFTQVNASGAVQSLAELLAEVRSGDYVYDEFRNHAMTAQYFEDFAMVRGITSLRGRYRTDPFDLDVRFTDILERSSGRWRMVTSHVTRLPKAAPQEHG